MKKETNALDSAWMLPQLSPNFRARQSVFGADDITSPNFLSQVHYFNDLSYPKLIFLFAAASLSALRNLLLLTLLKGQVGFASQKTLNEEITPVLCFGWFYP